MEQMRNLSTQIVKKKIRTVLEAKMLAETTVKCLEENGVHVPVELRVEAENFTASLAEPTSYDLIMAEAMIELERKLQENDAATEVKRQRILERIDVINGVFDRLSKVNKGDAICNLQ